MEKYICYKFKLSSSDLRNVCPKCTSGRASFGNKIRRFNDNMYIYIKNNANLIYIHF